MKRFIGGLVIGLIVGAASEAALARWHPEAGLVSQAVLDTRVVHMTPGQFRSRCGQLVSDKLVRSAWDDLPAIIPSGKPAPPNERDLIVRMRLPDGETKNVTAAFNRDRGKWVLGSVGGVYVSGFLNSVDPGSLKTIEELYPCTINP